MKVVLHTVGTSLLTNCDRESARELHALANRPEKELSGPQRALIARVRERAREALAGGDVPAWRDLSAELNGLLALYPEGLAAAGRDRHFLLVSDTPQGRVVGELLSEWAQNVGLTAEVVALPDLRTDDAAGFASAMSDLVKWAYETLPGYREQRWRVVFNVTGGFKSVQGFVQTLGMFLADEIVSIYVGHELLRIPKLPVRLEVRGWFEQHLRAARRLANGLALEDGAGLEGGDALLMRVDGEVCLSPWGGIAWQEAAAELYREGVQDSPSARIRYGPDFLASTEGLEAKRLREVNRRVDQLAAWWERPAERRGQKPLRGLDYKRLRGNPCPPSTHEFDAWHDGATARVFCHEDGDTVVLDRLGPALH